MGFRENLLKKIEIEALSQSILSSIDPQDSTKRIDREAMRRLLEMGAYAYRKALDNELKIYRTTAEDIGLRKSPTVKEMVSFRNAIKILSDKDVVVSRKADSVSRIRSELVSALDLSFSTADITSLAEEGSEALKNGYAEGVVEILSLFAELLHFKKAPKIFQVSHHHTWGTLERPREGEWRYGPLVMFDMMHNSLKMIEKPISSLDKGALEKFHLAAKDANDADLAGDGVWQALQNAVLEKGVS